MGEVAAGRKLGVLAVLGEAVGKTNSPELAKRFFRVPVPSSSSFPPSSAPLGRREKEGASSS